MLHIEINQPSHDTFTLCAMDEMEKEVFDENENCN